MPSTTNKSSRPLMLATTAGALLMAAAPTWGQTSSFTLYGMVRDFPESHVDFGLPGAMAGPHVAGNVDLIAAGDGDPIYAGSGFGVNTQWYEKNANEIAPHMFNVSASSAVILVNPAVTDNNPTLDTYDPDLGLYGGTNIGPMPNIVSGSVMPAFPPIPDLGASLGTLTFPQNKTTLINTSFRCENFELKNRHEVTIDGDVTIIVDGNFITENNTDIIINPGSSLTLFLMSNVQIANFTHLNTVAGDYTALTIYYAGVAPINLENNIQIYGTLYSPNADLMIQNNADFHGAVIAQGLIMVNGAGLHIAGPGGSSTCANVADVGGSAGVGSGGSVNDAASFNQWFNTIPGVNANASVPLTFTQDGMGTYEFSTPDYTPIDNRLFGNEGETHNRNFTLELIAKFNNVSCDGHFFEFTGDGDVWLFVDEKLVIDLAGPQIGGHQYIDIDRLGLVDGQTYHLRFFYAQRVNSDHPFTIRTNLNLLNDLDGQAPAMAMFD